LVTGGTYVSELNNIPLSSTELLVGTAKAWVYTGELPSPRSELGGANIDNKILMTGGDDDAYDTYDGTLEFDPLTGQWKLLERNTESRPITAGILCTSNPFACGHAVSVINYSEVAQFCE